MVSNICSATGGREGRGAQPGGSGGVGRGRGAAAAAPPGAAGGHAPVLGARVQGAVPRVGREAQRPQRHVVAAGEAGECVRVRACNVTGDPISNCVLPFLVRRCVQRGSRVHTPSNIPLSLSMMIDEPS